MKRRNATEQAVAEVVVAWLEALGADVYQEVEVSGGVADIVAKVRAEIWIVEVKTSLSLALVTQGMERRRLAHRVYIAAPHTKNMRDVAELCREIGIGMLRVSPFDEITSYRDRRVIELAPSRRWNSRPVALARKLSPEHKTHAKAGAASAAGRWTPFRATCEAVAQRVRREPGITLKALVDSIEHHYASNAGARSSLAHWIERGKVPGVRLERADGKVLVFPAQEAA